MTDAARLDIAKQYLRRTYAADLNGLKALAKKVAEAAFEAVTITGDGFAGGNAQGVVLFEPMAYLGAVEALIAELDPDNTPAPPASSTFADFSRGALET